MVIVGFKISQKYRGLGDLLAFHALGLPPCRIEGYYVSRCSYVGCHAVFHSKVILYDIEHGSQDIVHILKYGMALEVLVFLYGHSGF